MYVCICMFICIHIHIHVYIYVYPSLNRTFLEHFSYLWLFVCSGTTTFGTDKKWYQRRAADTGPGPGAVRPPPVRVKGGRFNRHRSLTFIEVAQRLGKQLPGPGLYNTQNAGFEIKGGHFNMANPKTHWQLIERHCALSLCVPTLRVPFAFLLCAFLLLPYSVLVVCLFYFPTVCLPNAVLLLPYSVLAHCCPFYFPFHTGVVLKMSHEPS